MWPQKKHIEKASSIQVGASSIHGRGVIAMRRFRSGEIIERAPLILLETAEREQLQQTRLFGYYFLINNSKTPVALALGFASLYNHAAHPNAVYEIVLKKKMLVITAFLPIGSGQEITINYHGKPGNEETVYFNEN